MDELAVYITFVNQWIDIPEFNIQVLVRPEDPIGKFYVRSASAGETRGVPTNVSVQSDSPPWDQG